MHITETNEKRDHKFQREPGKVKRTRRQEREKGSVVIIISKIIIKI